jgi:hypothetical protein
MAALVWTNAEVVINSDDISAYVRSVTLNLVQDTQEDTAMGDTARSYIAGLKGSTLSLELNDDYADNALDEILWDIYALQVPGYAGVACTVKPVKGTAISAANPEFQFNALMPSFAMGGGVGEVARKPVEFVVTGNVTRDITP